MSDARAIKATFSTWRPVNGRKVLQLVFEVPIEQQGEVLTMLGAPDDKWCAIAVLNTKPAEVQRCSVNHADYIGKCPGCHVALPGLPSQRGTTLDQAFIEPGAKGARGDSRERPAHQPPFKKELGIGEFAKPKKRFEDYPLSAQCAMRCNEAQFHAFLNTLYGSFTRVITDPATFVRGKLRIASRKEIDTNAVAGYEWIEMERSYQNWLTDQKYAGARR